MSAADLISKRTRNAFREELVGWTLAEISTEFDNEGFSPDHTHDPQVSGQRRGLVEQLYHAIDFGDPRQASRVLEVFHTVVVKARSSNTEIAQALVDHLHRDGVDTQGASFKLPIRAHTSLQPLSAVAASLTAEQLHSQIARINASIETDPALAIGTAKEMVETTCKTILADLGAEHATLDLGDLVKAASKALKLVPDGVPNETKGADAIKKTLRSLGATVAGLGEMRNFYGSGHGQDGRPKGLKPRHARLAVGAASTLAMFLFETHDDRRR
ncbi:MAG: abortive infection family protein [Hyphomicrobium sp.]|nr:abortive infection family protein [Hyphomicrobium sp.]